MICFRAKYRHDDYSATLPRHRKRERETLGEMLGAARMKARSIKMPYVRGVRFLLPMDRWEITVSHLSLSLFLSLSSRYDTEGMETGQPFSFPPFSTRGNIGASMACDAFYVCDVPHSTALPRFPLLSPCPSAGSSLRLSNLNDELSVFDAAPSVIESCRFETPKIPILSCKFVRAHIHTYTHARAYVY